MESNSFLKRSVDEYKNGSKINKVRTALIGIISSDPGFKSNKYEEAIKYVEKNGVSLDILFENLDENNVPKMNNDRQQWDRTYFAKASINCERNFCRQRIEHLKDVGKDVYGININNNISNKGINSSGEQLKNELSRQTNMNLQKKRQMLHILLCLMLAAVIILMIFMIKKI